MEENETVADDKKDISKVERQEATHSAGAAVTESTNGVWTEGMLIPGEKLMNAPAARVATEDALHPSETRRMDKEAAGRVTAGKMSLPLLEFIVTQQPLHTSPPEQQKVDQRKHHAIPTYAQQVGAQLQLTLYPDSGFRPSDIARARVERISDDSIVVHVGSQMIGYRLPQSIIQKQTRK